MRKITPKQCLPVSQTALEQKIFIIRGRRVMLDVDLAELYGVPTKRLNEQVRRNIKRFPEEFMFQLTWEESKFSRSQNATLNRGQNVKFRLFAFTEHGVAMLASVLNSERAIQVNIKIIRAFIRLNQYLSTHLELARKFKELEQRIGKQDKTIESVISVINELLLRPAIDIPKTKFRVRGFK
jgi:phage regulator Rha-like protein